MVTFAFMDTETTGLHDGRKPWDVALIVWACRDDDYARGQLAKFQWFVDPVDLDWATADAYALEVGRFWARHPHASLLKEILEREYNELPLDAAGRIRVDLLDRPFGALPQLFGVRRLDAIAEDVYRLTNQRAYICGSNPSFDMQTMEGPIRSLGYKPGWHYHPVDVPSVIEGFLYGQRKYHGDRLPVERKSDQFCRAIGIEPDNYERHSALGDCELFFDAWRRITTL